MIKKEAFEICGYFDENLIQTYTEPDFAKMIEKKGFKCCIVPKAKTYHKIKKEDDLNTEINNSEENKSKEPEEHTKCSFFNEFKNKLNRKGGQR